MPHIKGTLGHQTIAEENISQGMSLKKTMSRRSDDPMNYIRIECKIPQSLKYNVGSLSVFNFAEEIDKVKFTKYTEILKL